MYEAVLVLLLLAFCCYVLLCMKLASTAKRIVTPFLTVVDQLESGPIAAPSCLSRVFADGHFSLRVPAARWCATLIDDHFAAFNLAAS